MDLQDPNILLPLKDESCSVYSCIGALADSYFSVKMHLHDNLQESNGSILIFFNRFSASLIFYKDISETFDIIMTLNYIQIIASINPTKYPATNYQCCVSLCK